MITLGKHTFPAVAVVRMDGTAQIAEAFFSQLLLCRLHQPALKMGSAVLGQNDGRIHVSHAGKLGRRQADVPPQVFLRQAGIVRKKKGGGLPALCVYSPESTLPARFFGIRTDYVPESALLFTGKPVNSNFRGPIESFCCAKEARSLLNHILTPQTAGV